MFRTIATEKSLKSLAMLSDELIGKYVDRMSAYPLVIKWVIGQVSLNQDIERVVQKINSAESDISKFCFEYIFKDLLSENAKKVLVCLAQSDDYLTQAVLMHVVELTPQEWEDVMRELELASLVILIHHNNEDIITTKYGLLSLTRAYLTSMVGIDGEIKEKLIKVQMLIEESKQTNLQHELSFRSFGGKNEEEYIATRYIINALTKSQSDDYQGAVHALDRAEQIAPSFATIYRTRAYIENQSENYNMAVLFFEKATKLNPLDPIAWYHWGNMEKDQGNYDKARLLLNEALKLVSYKPSILIALGSVAIRSSKFQDAINIFQESLKYINNDREMIVAYTALANAYCGWSENYEDEGNLIKAIEFAELGLKAVEEVHQLGQLDSKALDTRMKCIQLLGKQHKIANNLEEAKKYLETVVFGELPKQLSWKQKKYYVNACSQLILVLLKIGDRTERIKEIYYKGLNIVNIEYKDKYRNLEFLFDRTRYTGILKYITTERSYGHIECLAISQDNILARVTQFVDDIRDISMLNGKRVSFSLSSDKKDKLEAKGILILEDINLQ